MNYHAGLHEIFMKGYEPSLLKAWRRGASHPWFIVGTVCVGAFMGQLDSSIAQLILPDLEAQFMQRLSTVSWVSIAYLLTLTACLPIVGRLADLYGRKQLYCGGFFVFIAGSALCGMAPNIPLLIGFRVLQAVGASLLQANSVAIIVTAAGNERRGRALGIQTTAQAIGLSVGPALGGFLVAAFGWRSVFWINVPFGLVGVLLGWLVLSNNRHHSQRDHFDWWGALTLAPALTALLVLIEEAQEWGENALGLWLAATAVVLLLPLFVWSERRLRDPLLHLDLLRIRAFWTGNLAGLFSYAILFGTFLLMPFVFERGFAEGPLAAGLRLTLVPVALGLVAPLSGLLHDSVGPRWLAVGGMALNFVACGIMNIGLSSVPPDPMPIMVSLIVLGMGQGFFTVSNNSSVMGAVPTSRTGEGGGILNLMRALGTSLGVAAATAILGWRIGAASASPDATIGATPSQMLAAAHDVVLAFATFAILAGVLSLSGHHNESAR